MRHVAGFALLAVSAEVAWAPCSAAPRHAGHRLARPKSPAARAIGHSWDAIGVLARPYLAAPAPEGGDQFPLAVSYQTAVGVTGSVGYHRAGDGHPLDYHEVDRAAATQFGRPNDTIGAAVSWRF